MLHCCGWTVSKDTYLIYRHVDRLRQVTWASRLSTIPVEDTQTL